MRKNVYDKKMIKADEKNVYAEKMIKANKQNVYAENNGNTLSIVQALLGSCTLEQSLLCYTGQVRKHK